jgi:ketosteroid isomerase-like protein
MAILDTEPDASGILSNLRELEAAENRKDIPSILGLLTDDFVFLHGDTSTEGKQDTGNMLELAARNYVSSKHIPLHVEVARSGEVGWLIGYELNLREEEGAVVETKQYYLIAYRKVEGEWKQAAVCLA